MAGKRQIWPPASTHGEGVSGAIQWRCAQPIVCSNMVPALQCNSAARMPSAHKRALLLQVAGQ